MSHTLNLIVLLLSCQTIHCFHRNLSYEYNMFDMCNVDLRPVITSSLGPGDSFQLLQCRSILATFSSFLELQTPHCVLISSLDIYLPSPPVRCVLSCFLSGSKQKFKWFEFFNKNQIAVLLSLHML